MGNQVEGGWGDGWGDWGFVTLYTLVFTRVDVRRVYGVERATNTPKRSATLSRSSLYGKRLESVEDCVKSDRSARRHEGGRFPVVLTFCIRGA